MPTFFRATALFLFSLFATFAASAAKTTATRTLHLPHIFGDHMVLQSQLPVPVWGTAPAGAHVTVRFASQEKAVTAAPNGRWYVQLDPLAVSTEPRVLEVLATAANAAGEAGERISFSDVLVGEVWLCSGQSNMDKPIGQQRGQKPVFNAEEEIRAADYPHIRLLKVTKARSATPAADFEGRWVACSPDTIDAIKFSAAGYFFGRKLHQQLGVPIGLIDSSWGGTRIEAWIPPTAFARVPSLADLAAAARHPGAKAEDIVPSMQYNAMIAPLDPFALRGVIWYQGESNVIGVNDGPRYLDKMIALVEGWREAWGRDVAFYYVQIAPHLYHVVRPQNVASPEDAPRLREAQTAAMTRLPHTGMIVTTDLVDNLFDIHPRNKKDVGERLARWALAKNYGRTDIEVSGPIFRSMDVQDNRAVLHFDHVDGGLVSRDGKPLTWFTIAGADGVFHPAEATIVGETVEVSSSKVAAPKIVRFGWDEAAQPNLSNAAGLPAVPFRTNNPLSLR